MTAHWHTEQLRLDLDDLLRANGVGQTVHGRRTADCQPAP